MLPNVTLHSVSRICVAAQGVHGWLLKMGRGGQGLTGMTFLLLTAQDDGGRPAVQQLRGGLGDGGQAAHAGDGLGYRGKVLGLRV